MHLTNKYLIALLILSGAVVFALLFRYVLNHLLKKLVAKTETDIDDRILGIVSKPLLFLIFTAGIYFAIVPLGISVRWMLWLDRLFFMFIAFTAAYVFANIFSLLLRRWFRVEKRFEKTPKLISKIVAIIVYIIAFLVILRKFHVEITPLIATLGIGGLAVGLALQGTLSNFFAGLNLISDASFKVGDFIEIDDGKFMGTVEDIGWRTTKIKTLANTLVTIPNSKIAESIIVNDNMPEYEMSILVECGVAYTSDLNKTEAVTLEVAKQIQATIPGAVNSFEPFMRFNSFGDSNINFVVALRIERITDKRLVIHEFIKALKDRYDKENIEISWPVRKIYTAS